MNIPRWELRQGFDSSRNHAVFTISKAVSSLKEVTVVGALLQFSKIMKHMINKILKPCLFGERMRRVHRLSDGYRNSEQDVGNTQSLTLTIQLCHLWTMTFPPLPFCPLNTGSDDSYEGDENSHIYIMVKKCE